MSSLPPFLVQFIEGIHPCLNFIAIGTAWSGCLIPLLVMLLYFSTPALRRQPIFLMNFFSVAVGIGFNLGLAVYNINVILHPEKAGDTSGSIAVLACAITLPVFIDIILAFRLYVVLPRSSTSKRMLCVVFVPLALFKIARLINIGLFMKKLSILLRSNDPSASLGSGFERFNPNHKIEWFLLVLDNCYASGIFLWKLGMGSRSAKSSGIVSSAKDTLKRLFYLATASFVFPCILGIGQLVFAFEGKGAYASYIFFTNVNVEINALHRPETTRISSFKAKSRGSEFWMANSEVRTGSEGVSEQMALPVEIVDEIVGHIDDSKTLLNCLLASRHFKPRILYETVSLRGKQLQDFRRAIDTNPHYAGYTIDFTIHTVWSQGPNPYRDLNYILSKLANLRSLTMRTIDWTWADYQKSLCPPLSRTLTNLTTLIWDDKGCDASPVGLVSACQTTLLHVEMSYEACGEHWQNEVFGGLSLPNLRSVRLPHGGGPTKPVHFGLRADEWKAANSAISKRQDGGFSVLWKRR
ncbi:hypothetical protein EYR40_006163 [Pleurotus pulmonarius]|nr:hypothetical protein EYR40_006163 [Pleurotus pulmonarius]